MIADVHEPAPGQDVPGAGSLVIRVDYYTDPLCCWCWAFEPVWRRFLATYGDRLRVRYVLAGMVRDWSSYSDPLNSISRPSQMGPLCAQVTELTGVEVNDRVWAEDPPESSLPACLAVKAAERQSEAAGDLYLAALRTALMRDGRNIGRREVLLEIARETYAGNPGLLDPDRLANDLNSESAADALREDIKLTRYHEIGRFPTLVLSGGPGPAIAVVGYRPFETLADAMQAITSPDKRL